MSHKSSEIAIGRDTVVDIMAFRSETSCYVLRVDTRRGQVNVFYDGRCIFADGRFNPAPEEAP